MRFSPHWLIFSLLVGGASLSLPALAQSELRAPNCESPDSREEQMCCGQPAYCAAYGFERPPLRAPNCGNASVSGLEAQCCRTPQLCESYGFQAPQAAESSASPEPPGPRTPNCENPRNPKEQACCDTPAYCAAYGLAPAPPRAPNCDSAPENSGEAQCCTSPALCERLGFERPELRASNCENPTSPQESTCCRNPAICEQVGFKPPTPEALAAAAAAAAAAKAKAKPELRTPNCENNQGGYEGRCCGTPKYCEQYGFKRPELRTPNCENPTLHGEWYCCQTQTHSACEDIGFHRPKPTTAAVTTAPAAKTPSAAPQPAQPKASPASPPPIPSADPGRIKRLTAADVAGATAQPVRKPEIPAILDGKIAGCGGTRDPVIRHNVMIMLKAPLGNIADPDKIVELYIQSGVENYDYSFDVTLKQIESSYKAMCPPGAVEQAYADYAAYQDDSLAQIESSRQQAAADAKNAAAQAAQAEAPLRTPNCDNPQTAHERKCCLTPMRCESYGFKHPPLRVPNCAKPGSGSERHCCQYPSAEVCEDAGFKRPGT